MDTFEVAANGITIRGVAAGAGPPVLLCHGFPETSASWRGLIERLASGGFRALAPDMRGYGGTSAPAAVESYSQFHLVGDMVGLLDALGIGSAAIVGHDWGAQVAWNAALMRPDRFTAVAGLSVPYAPRGPKNLLDVMRRAGRGEFYMLHFQEPGRAEAELDPDPRRSLLAVYAGLAARAGGAFDGLVQLGSFLGSLGPPAASPPWLDGTLLAGRGGGLRPHGASGAG